MEELLTGLSQKHRQYIEDAAQIADDQVMRGFLVGGVVRDLLLKRPTQDIDITIEGDGIAVARQFAEKYKGDIVIYKPFGTATVTLAENVTIDFATTRSEIYKKPGAMPTVQIGDIFTDLARRDITINAMAIGITAADRGRLLDEFKGLNDLGNQIIKVLHAKSFDDDPTRLFRVVRYSERLGFTIENWTASLMQQAVKNGNLKTVSLNRIRNEIKLIQQEKNSREMMTVLHQYMGTDPVFCKVIKE